MCGGFWFILGCGKLWGCGKLSTFRLWGPVWHTVYSSGKYEVSHGLSSLLGFGEMRCVACLWGMVPRGSSYFSSEHTVYPPAGGYRVLSLLLLCGRCENGVNYTLMSNAGCVAAAQNIRWTIVQCVLKWSVDKARESYVLENMCSDFVDTNLLRI